MGIPLSAVEISTVVASAVFPFFRIGAFLLSMPLIGGALLPVMVRLMLAIALTIVTVPFIHTVPTIEIFSFAAILAIFQEILLGLAMGLILQVLFQVFTMAGNIVSMQCGLGFASLVDPSSEASIPIISQCYSLFINLLFLSLNGHLVVMTMIIDSFNTLPVVDSLLISTDIYALLQFAGVLFNDAVLVALPAIISLLIVNLALAITTKASPQLNIFTLGFPITLILGLILVYLSIAPVFHEFETLSLNAYASLKELIVR